MHLKPIDMTLGPLGFVVQMSHIATHVIRGLRSVGMFLLNADGCIYAF